MTDIVDYRYGFAVTVRDAPTKIMRGEEVLDINANVFRDAVFSAMIINPYRLSAEQIMFARKVMRLTRSDLSDLMLIPEATYELAESERFSSGLEEITFRQIMLERHPNEMHKLEIQNKKSTTELLREVVVTAFNRNRSAIRKLIPQPHFQVPITLLAEELNFTRRMV